MTVNRENETEVEKRKKHDYFQAKTNIQGETITSRGISTKRDVYRTQER